MYLNLEVDIPVDLNLVSIGIRIVGVSPTSCFLSILSIFRICQKLKYIQLVVELTDEYEANLKTVLHTSSVDQNNLPILTDAKSLILVMNGLYWIKFVDLLLRCMPNLMWFVIYYNFKTI
ncbi:hypothetical protein I4U23_006142 [Adineta vaga]|nr:hypothetical protein I4U23_006142 [Adineta vaga]